MPVPTLPKILTRPAVHIEYNLEALRGFAALLVVFGHAITNDRLLDPGYTVQGWTRFIIPVHLAVLLFFVLSGYVIGYSTKQRLAGQAIGTYLKKRIVRIYPIYMLTIGLALLVSIRAYSLLTVLGNLSLTQILLTDVVKENDPSWSLHYEVLFYLLFIPISYSRLAAGWLALGCLGLGIAVRLILPEQPLVASYAFGFTFWLIGLWLAGEARTLSRRDVPAQHLVGLLLVVLSLHYYNIFDTILSKMLAVTGGERLLYGQSLREALPYATQIEVRDLALLPVAAALILIFARVDFPWRRWAMLAVAGLPALTFAYLALHFHEPNMGPWGVATPIYLLGVFLVFTSGKWVWDGGVRVMRKLAQVGSISYGLYIVHAPLLYLMHRLVPSFSGTGVTYSVRLAVFVFVSLGVAYWLEKKLQPWIKGRVGM